ncbi:2-hydroxyglutaryl-CoA dehydratase [Candidatus Epulonipiscium fishelsonii]|uniref:2-hydroxyglutaryl-CoA dehydratase n=1 Tax=Candidatus Epulonipiscium fishelsonii TaxID=77094 RepID=A0ACC8X8Y9_9FIRM|nr:2-hydroxyglutaryl-CoA dehydratase [Epulopiscium sp. SCG-B11WGA-EpuloA1]ONI43615.1 2-hydroxyglutaryl-CoA dehydratase [Epulopiscium sp. SCG-B05WGA-EpuloA1]
MDRIEFTKEMKKDYTILVPDMLTIHFKMICTIFRNEGYNLEILYNGGKDVVDSGLKYVHNDTCYPALLVIGQFLDALNSGKYDVNKTALIIMQTGGGCRASNYIHLLRKALLKAGYSQVPVISLNLTSLEKNSGFKITLPIIKKSLSAISYGDLLMQIKNQVKPYEVQSGMTDQLVTKWQNKLCNDFKDNKSLSLSQMKSNFKEIINSFSKIAVNKVQKIKVGIVGEIYVKYSSLGNNNLEDFLLSQNCEYMIPGLLEFILFKIDNRLDDIKLYGGNKLKFSAINALFEYIRKIEVICIKTIENSNFVPPSYYLHKKSLVNGLIGYGNRMGEGWLLPADMLELCEQGYNNIICAQPFGCLPTHIVGKAMIRPIKERFPTANIITIDYDPGASRVNQENRIKLMLAIATEQIPSNQPIKTKEEKSPNGLLPIASVL